MEFRDAIWPTKTIFAGNMRRKDLSPARVAKNNMFLRNKLGLQLKSTKIIRREDFDDNIQFHFDKFGVKDFYFEFCIYGCRNLIDYSVLLLRRILYRFWIDCFASEVWLW